MDTIAAGLEAAYPDTNRGFGVQVLPLRRSFVGPDSTRTRARLDGGGGVRAADHVRQPRQPDAGPRRGAPARDCGALGDGGKPAPVDVDDVQRKRRHRGAGRHTGLAGIAMGHRRRGCRAADVDAVLGGDRHRRARDAVHDWRDAVHDTGRWACCLRYAPPGRISSAT